MRTEEYGALFSLLGIAMMWRASYELSRPKPNPPKQMPLLYDKRPGTNFEQTAITPKQRKWADKATKKYAEAQEKKWRNWNKAMFEPD